MPEKIHTLETELIDQVLKEQPDFVGVLEDLASRYGLPARHVLLISNYLQKDLPPGVPAGADKLLALCRHVKEGYYSIGKENGDLVLFLEREDIPEIVESAPEAPGENTMGDTQPETAQSETTQEPRSRELSLPFILAALCALVAAGYFLYRYMGQ